jgi:hypothetical protein
MGGLEDFGGLFDINLDFTPIIIGISVAITIFTIVMTIVNYFLKIRIVKIGTLQALKEFYADKNNTDNVIDKEEVL